jgi:hypothetical protein
MNEINSLKEYTGIPVSQYYWRFWLEYKNTMKVDRWLTDKSIITYWTKYRLYDSFPTIFLYDSFLVLHAIATLLPSEILIDKFEETS